jgi:DNA-binding CsgD family transcriptional regulator
MAGDPIGSLLDSVAGIYDAILLPPGNDPAVYAPYPGAASLDAGEPLQAPWLLPHWQRAAQLRARLADGAGTAFDARSLIRLLPLPCLLTDGEARNLGRNALCETPSADLKLDLSGPFVRFRRAHAQMLWTELVAWVAQQPTAQSHVLAAESGDPWIVHLTPLTAVAGSGSERRAAASRLILVIFERQAKSSEQAIEGFGRRHGLTVAEQSVLELLCDGQPLIAIALARGCAISTVRAHLAAIFQKTRCRRQRELVVAARAA